MGKTALLYDFLHVKGGAEMVTLDLCQHFPEIDLIAAWANHEYFPELQAIAERCHFLTSMTTLPGWLTVKSVYSFLKKCPDLSGYENVIVSGGYAPVAIMEKPAKRNVYYCHTPPRFLYDLKEFYLQSMPFWQRPLFKSLVAWYQPLYEKGISAADVVLCNSINTQGRLKNYTGLESEVLYPPMNTQRFKYLSSGDYFLSTARLEPYKRVEAIVRAFMQMPDRKLVVASGGSQETYLREITHACPNIEFTGWLPEAKLAELVGNCLATIYIPMDEDFGMSPVESMAAGKPVIGVNEGGLKETILPHKTGWLLPEDLDVQDLVSMISSLDDSMCHDLMENCFLRAKDFDSSVFFDGIRRVIRE